MILLKITAIIGILDTVLFGLIAMKTIRIFKARYPELTSSDGTYWDEVLLVGIKLGLYLFCPIMNIFLLWTLLARDEELIEKAVQRTYEKRMKKMEEKHEHDNLG